MQAELAKSSAALAEDHLWTLLQTQEIGWLKPTESTAGGTAASCTVVPPKQRKSEHLTGEWAGKEDAVNALLEHYQGGIASAFESQPLTTRNELREGLLQLTPKENKTTH